MLWTRIDGMLEICESSTRARTLRPVGRNKASPERSPTDVGRDVVRERFSVVLPCTVDLIQEVRSYACAEMCLCREFTRINRSRTSHREGLAQLPRTPSEVDLRASKSEFRSFELAYVR